MNRIELRMRLKQWREEAAAREGVELYRVLPNAVLDEIISTLPCTKDALLRVKGIKEAKYRKYGARLIEIVSLCEESGSASVESASADSAPSSERPAWEKEEVKAFLAPVAPDTPLSVGQFLDSLNIELSGMAARIRGEVSSVDERERVVYFSLKDSQDESTINCLIFRSAYMVSGVRIAIGDEIVVEGSPDVYKPSGRLSLKVGVIEFAGEGALKKAYEELRKKLETEGLFAPERKRAIPEFPERIALLTSKDGAAIGDFMMNVGQHGYQVTLYPSSVEGKKAVFELLKGVEYFNAHPERYDVLVVIRGGGSLESLQAFNNEALVRAIAASRIPVISGIGHEKDISLAQLVADSSASTPTAAARAVRQSWEEAEQGIHRAARAMEQSMNDAISFFESGLAAQEAVLVESFQNMKERIKSLADRFLEKKITMSYALRSSADRVWSFEEGMKKTSSVLLAQFHDRLKQFDALLMQFDPNRALRLGYSLVRLSSGALLRSSTDAKLGDTLDIRLSKGSVSAEVREISP